MIKFIFLLSTLFLIGCECATSDSTINYFQKKGYVVFVDKNIVIDTSKHIIYSYRIPFGGGCPDISTLNILFKY